MGQPKRVWSNKKTVWDGKKSVWLQDGELKTYDGNWEDAGSDLQTYGSQREEVSGNAILDVYDSNTPEPIGTPEDGIKATYTFKDYDGTVLKTGTVDDGGTPVAPADPTREATAQYTYTFAGWNPSVGPIAKNTVYTATYTSTVNKYDITFVDEDGTTELDSQELDYGATPVYEGETPTKTGYIFNGWTPAIATVTGDATYTATYISDVTQYTVSIASNDESMGTVDVASVTVDEGTAIDAAGNILNIGETMVTATPEAGCVFSSWGELPATVTEDLTITATFELPVNRYTVTIVSDNEDMGTVDVDSVADQDFGTIISAEGNVLTIGETTVTATAETGYVFSSWTDENGNLLPDMVTEDLIIKAIFEPNQVE